MFSDWQEMTAAYDTALKKSLFHLSHDLPIY